MARYLFSSPCLRGRVLAEVPHDELAKEMQVGRRVAGGNKGSRGPVDTAGWPAWPRQLAV